MQPWRPPDFLTPAGQPRKTVRRPAAAGPPKEGVPGRQRRVLGSDQFLWSCGVHAVQGTTGIYLLVVTAHLTAPWKGHSTQSRRPTQKTTESAGVPRSSSSMVPAHRLTVRHPKRRPAKGVGRRLPLFPARVKVQPGQGSKLAVASESGAEVTTGDHAPRGKATQ